MANIHSSVSYCRKCDVYCASDLMDRCEHCTAFYCPECRTATSDPDLFCCSERCAALFDFWQRRKANNFASPVSEKWGGKDGSDAITKDVGTRPGLS